jgi:hypothetical protein
MVKKNISYKLENVSSEGLYTFVDEKSTSAEIFAISVSVNLYKKLLEDWERLNLNFVITEQKPPRIFFDKNLGFMMRGKSRYSRYYVILDPAASEDIITITYVIYG